MFQTISIISIVCATKLVTKKKRKNACETQLRDREIGCKVPGNQRYREATLLWTELGLEASFRLAQLTMSGRLLFSLRFGVFLSWAFP